MAGSVQNLDAVLTTIETDLATLQTQNAETLALLQSKATANPAIDLSQEIARVQKLDLALSALTAAQVAADAPPSTHADVHNPRFLDASGSGTPIPHGGACKVTIIKSTEGLTRNNFLAVISIGTQGRRP